MSDLIHLIYNSAAIGDFADENLESLLSQARKQNASLNVTGMLLYVDGCFFQILEGPKNTVDWLFGKISADPRHGRITTIIHEPIARRAFSEWTMGFNRMSRQEIGHIDGFNDFFATGRVLTDIDPGRARKLLTAFKQGRWRVKLSGRVSRPALPVNAQTPFTYAFQPIVDAAARSVVGYEALVRGLAQESATHVLQRIPLGQISAFDESGRAMAIDMASRLGLKSCLHLNLVPHIRLLLPNTIDATLEVVSRSGIGIDRIVFEIKHEVSVEDPVALGAWLRDYRRQGLRISIDDFGSGHAGLALLDHYQPDMISLSMWLVRRIEGHGARQAILRGLVQTCGDLGVGIIAKGVESLAEYDWLRSEGIDFFQGFLFAQPGFESLPEPTYPVGADE